MHGINMKPSPAVPVATTASKPAMSNSVWRNKLESSEVLHSDKVAKLLQRAGIIGKEQYCDAAEIAESLNKSIDQVIATSFLSAIQGELCVSALSFLERGLVNEELASQAMSLANAKGLSFAEGLKYFGYGW